MTKNEPQVVPPGEGGHLVDIHALPVDALQSILRKLNQKSQTVNRLFRDNYVITINDIRQIIEKVNQEFHYCTIISRSATVSLILSKQERHDFRTWDEFERFDTTQPSRTISLQVEMTYDVMRNQDETPERYVVQVSVQNLNNPRGVIFGRIAIAEAGNFPIPPTPISASVTYNNYILGKNLMSTVENWESSLEKKEDKIISMLQGYSSRFPDIAFFTGTISGIILAASISPIRDSLGLTPLSVEGWIIGASLAVFIFGFIGKQTGQYAESHVDRHSPGNNITLTKGDENHERKLAKQNRTSLIHAGGSLAIMILQIIVSVWAAEIIPPLSSLI